jgi:quercetin dioxygenase-like cupin family protein
MLKLFRGIALLALIAVVVVPVLAFACGDDDDSTSSAFADFSTVTRDILATAAPNTAPGQQLGLSRVVIPAGQEIAKHTHPGTQLALVVEGTLTYTVLTGEVMVTRGAGGPTAHAEKITAGMTTDIRPGDSLVETPGMVHSAKNNGDGPVVIYLSSLFTAGAPASSPAQ